MKKDYSLNRFNWQVEAIWYKKEVTDDGVRALERELEDRGCPKSKIKEMISLVENGNVNSASVYSDCSDRKSIMIIGNTTSDSELVNSITHEIIHLSRHIKHCGNPESLAQELGDFAGDLYYDISNSD